MTGWLLAGTTFLASGVEAVEALTIVLAVGFARSWRPALSGAAWATIAILAIIAILGPAIIHYVPLAALKLGVGLFLMLFGLAWLRKAVLRYSGRKSLHDEEAIYRREYDALCAGGAAAPRGDRIGFLTAFNGVFLEGLEVAVIVVTFGAAGAHGFVWSALGAAAAALVVAGAGLLLHKPLRRVPENAMKFVVGIMLTSFGTFWAGEGLGIAWWETDLSLAWIVAVFVAVSAICIALARRPGARAARESTP